MAAFEVMAQESLNRAITSQSVMNYQSIFEGFLSMGIPEDQIKPRENVFTFWAWKALGRRVMKGQHGVKACTFIPVSGKNERDEQTGEVKKSAGFRMARTTTVFHISQTEPDPNGPALDFERETPIPIEYDAPALTLVPAPGKAAAVNPLIARFRTWAEAMQPKIDHAGREMTQNPTPKRNREYQSRMHDCRNMERLQRALRELANAHKQGTCPDALAELKTRDEIGRLVRKFIDGSKGGYYSCIESDDYEEKTPAARLLQGIIEGNSVQRAERERVRKIEALEAEVKLSNIPGYFPTPAPVVSTMLDRAQIDTGMVVLEPSAGNGNIADAIRAECSGVAVHCFEWNPRLAEILKLKGYAVIGSDFTEATGAEIYDRAVMNPPFERQQDIDHVRKAFDLLKPNGILVSIMAPGFEFRSDRKSNDFREWLESIGATWEDLPEGSFKASGTGISTRLVVIQK